MNEETKKDNNSGYRNSGNRNSGNYNSGDCNSGSYNSGNYNSGNYNSGYYNSGDCNSGSYNSGNCNSGNYNSGNCNSGYCNSGNYNSGNYNSGNYNSGNFNTTEPMVRMFNKETNILVSEFDEPIIYLPMTRWISESDMSDEQKKADPKFFVKGGTLIKMEYKEAWEIAWSEADNELKNKFLTLPNFDAEIFFEITGVDVREKVEIEQDEIIELNGKKYKLIKE